MMFIWQNVQQLRIPLQRIPTSFCSKDLEDNKSASGRGNILRTGRVKMP